MSKQKTPYKEYLAKLAQKRNTTPEALEEMYGDMIYDIWLTYSTVEDCAKDLDNDDAEYEEGARRSK